MIGLHSLSAGFALLALCAACGTYRYRRRSPRLSALLLGLFFLLLAAALGVEIRASTLSDRDDVRQLASGLRTVIVQIDGQRAVGASQTPDKALEIANIMLSDLDRSQRDRDLTSKILALLLLVAGGFKLGAALSPASAPTARRARDTDNANNAAPAVAMGEHL